MGEKETWVNKNMGEENSGAKRWVTKKMDEKHG